MNVVSVVNLCWWFGVGVFGGAADGDEERERTGKQEQQKERREPKSKAGPYAWDIGQLIFSRKTFGFEYH